MGFQWVLITLDPTTKTSIQQEERCPGPTHFHYKRHRGRVHPVSLQPSKMKTSLREVCPASPSCSGAPQACDPWMPSCTVPHPWLRGEASMPQVTGLQHFCSFLRAWGVWHSWPERPFVLTGNQNEPLAVSQLLAVIQLCREYFQMVKYIKWNMRLNSY